MQDVALDATNKVELKNSNHWKMMSLELWKISELQEILEKFFLSKFVFFKVFFFWIKMFFLTIFCQRIFHCFQDHYTVLK